MEQRRNSFLDFQKAILIFCVVWTHCATSLEAGIITWKDNYLNVTVTTFQMPLFILIGAFMARNLALLNFVIAPTSACILIAISILIFRILSNIPIVKDVIFGVSLRKLKFQNSRTSKGNQ